MWLLVQGSIQEGIIAQYEVDGITLWVVVCHVLDARVYKG